jgi:hypothetical protein
MTGHSCRKYWILAGLTPHSDTRTPSRTDALKDLQKNKQGGLPLMKTALTRTNGE